MRSVRTIYTALMVLLAKATDRELARMVSCLREENKILRARLGTQVHVTPKERARLLRFCAAAWWQATYILEGYKVPELAERLRLRRPAGPAATSPAVADVFAFAVAALAINYRVNAELVGRLRLLGDEHLVAIVKAVADFAALASDAPPPAATISVRVAWE